MSFDTIKRFTSIVLRRLLIYSISILFVHIPNLTRALTTGHEDENKKLQRRIRAKQIDPTDPFSPYRAVEVLDNLRTTPDEFIHTLADIPDYCVERYSDKETLGVREILGVEDEKQSNGKIFKKVCFFFVFLSTNFFENFC